MSIRVATFNAENLLQRFAFPNHKNWATDGEMTKASVDPVAAEHLKRQLTAQALAQCEADIVCLQEVENIQALVDFDRDYLQHETGEQYTHKVLVEGNDGRGIDVAFMARARNRSGQTIEIKSITSHAHLSYGDLGLMNDALVALDEHPDERVFRRDCLVVDLAIAKVPLTVVVLHLKSMGTDKVEVDGRQYTMPIRDAESRGVRKILLDRFGDEIGNSDWLICGDLNDYQSRLEVEQINCEETRFHVIDEKQSGISSLLDPTFAENLVSRRPSDNQWTLFYSKAPFQHHLVQLDYILASRSMARRNPRVVPEIVRNAQPNRVIMPTGQQVERFTGTGWDKPKGSDHCPVVVNLDLA